eukprot:372295_1
MMVHYQLQLTFALKNTKVDQVVNKSMDIFRWFTMENELRCDEQIYLTPVQLCFFRSPPYPPDYSQNCGTKKYFAVYPAKTYSMVLALLVLFRDIIEYNKEYYKDNGNDIMRGDWIYINRKIIYYLNNIHPMLYLILSIIGSFCCILKIPFL